MEKFEYLFFELCFFVAQELDLAARASELEQRLHAECEDNDNLLSGFISTIWCMLNMFLFVILFFLYSGSWNRGEGTGA